MELLNKKILVTGAAGFIGSHLVENLLNNGCAVRALLKYNSRNDCGYLTQIKDNKALEIVFGDIRDSFATSTYVAGCNAIFHLAALIGIPYSYIAPQSYVDTNINGTINILEAAKLHKIEKVVVTSTSEVYGTAIKTPMSEEHPLHAQSPYSASKISADMMARAYSDSFGLPVTIVRPFNTFGPRQSMRAVIPTIIVQAITQKIINLGDLTPVRDFNYIQNTVNGFILAMKNGKSNAEIYNLASGEGHSIGETAKQICNIIGQEIKIKSEHERIRPDKSEVRVLIGDSTKAQKDLSWQPSISFKDGLSKTISWIQNHISEYPEPKQYVR